MSRGSGSAPSLSYGWSLSTAIADASQNTESIVSHSNTSSSEARRRKVEKPYYRELHLGPNNIYMAGSDRSLSPPAAELMAIVTKVNTPQAAPDLDPELKDMAQGASETEVERYWHTKLFKHRDGPLRRDDRAPRTKAHVPSQAGSHPPVSIPVPDSLYGYDRNFFGNPPALIHMGILCSCRFVPLPRRRPDHRDHQVLEYLFRTSAGDLTVLEETVFSAILISIIRLVGLRDRAFELVDSVTEDIEDSGRSRSSLSMYGGSDAPVFGAHSGMFVSCRTGAGTGAAGPERPGRGVAFGSTISSTDCDLSLLFPAFLAAILIDDLDGDRGG
ncbi:hypothetical protein BCR34DRAFT_667820 [Clohesyomyces aquaticus]|uniref:Uncharacterized protein n=1 Tax=Clohesyomyces aquaticus TaxID=1231657 RepID=A0A1Y1YVN6_9PLEO|nr:hypothetical protein BCR34DRAFT_667820 [Clohesyomyces aquaticus]